MKAKKIKKTTVTVKFIGKFKCPHPSCGRSFEKASALGGHFSKSHKGESATYTRKIEIRNSRKDKRELLSNAKELLKQRFPKITRSHSEYSKLITQIKKELTAA